MKISKTWGFVALAALSIPMLTSCKDDEPGNGDDAGKDIIDIDGQKITAIGSYRISYDSKGRVTEVTTNNGYDVFEIDYSNGKIIMDDEEGTIKFTKEGYISEISQSYEDTEGSYTYTGNGTLKFSYKDNHVMSISSTYKEIQTNSNGEKINWEGSESATLTWSNNNLVSSNNKFIEYYNGEVYEEEEYSFSVTYGNVANKYHQFPISLADFIFDYEEMDVLIALGLAGHGPAYLPTAIQENGNDYSYDLKISLNSNGSIDTESYVYETYNYVYGKVSTKSAFETIANPKKINVRNLFVTRSHRH